MKKVGKLRADKKNYKKAFTTHLEACKNWNEGCRNSKRVLMCYCVECGLKYLIMDDNKICRVSQANEEIQKSLGSHDFKILLKEVKKAGVYRFKSFRTEFNDTVVADNYHQLCRYCIGVKDEDRQMVEEFDKELNKIAGWLSEVI